jgi:Ni/Co efflux regulator RcnB
MNRLGKFAALSTLSAVLFSGAAFAQDNHQDATHDNHAYVHHTEWKKGAKMKQEDWGRGEPVDYRTSHLQAPPNGYAWREVDGNNVLASISTGSIRLVIKAN